MNIIWGGTQVVLLCAAALGYGGVTFPFFDTGKSASERLVYRFALGLGLLIMATMAGGWLRIWGPWFHHGILAAGILLLAARPPRAKRPIQPLFYKRDLLWTGPALALLLFYAAFPPTFYDALLYHLGIPGYYLQAGGFASWPENIFSALPQNAEMLNLLLLSGGSIHGPKFLSLAMAMALLLFLTDWGRASKLRHPWMPAVIFFSIPEVLFLAATEKNDLLLMLFLLPAVRLLANLKDRTDNWKTCTACGIFLGLASGVKWQGILYGLAFVIAYFLTSRTPLGKRFLQIVLIGFIILLMVTPWLIKNQITFGNPVHPYLSGLFSDRGEAASQARQVTEVVRRGQGFTPGTILSFCLHLFLSPYSLGLTHITGVIVMLLFPLLFLRSKGGGRSLLLMGCAVGFLMLLAAARVPRYFLPIFMVLSVPLAAAWERLEEKVPQFRRLALLLFFSLVSIQVVQAVSLLERMTLGAKYVWVKSRHELPVNARYLDILPYYPAVEFINGNLSGNARVAFIGEERTFYMQRPFLASSSFDKNPLLEDLMVSEDVAAWVVRLQRSGITHILYSRQGLAHMRRNSAASGASAALLQRLEKILASWPELFNDGRYAVYQVGR